MIHIFPWLSYVKGLILEQNIFIYAQRLLWEIVFLMKFVLSQNPITQPKF